MIKTNKFKTFSIIEIFKTVKNTILSIYLPTHHLNQRGIKILTFIPLCSSLTHRSQRQRPALTLERRKLKFCANVLMIWTRYIIFRNCQVKTSKKSLFLADKCDRSSADLSHKDKIIMQVGIFTAYSSSIVSLIHYMYPQFPVIHGHSPPNLWEFPKTMQG